MNEEINKLKTMTVEEILTLATERGYTIRDAPKMPSRKTDVLRDGKRIGGSPFQRDEWMNAANVRLWQIQIEE